ncbi:hypothetical protein [Streptomyces sp. F63]|uniref:rhamnogalacturonan lyase family protein n=1 Tax=Streptomyces sp. F63 TaxID=2824887 RepID=UPI0035B35D15
MTGRRPRRPGVAHLGPVRSGSAPPRTGRNRRITALLHDARYRPALAWQNTARNQPTHPSFFIGDGMTAPPRPEVTAP